MPIKQREALSYVGAIEEAMVKGFPFEVPPEYQDRPLLLVGAGMRDCACQGVGAGYQTEDTRRNRAARSCACTGPWAWAAVPG